jgi:predicted O-methyltransferase YrrM
MKLLRKGGVIGVDNTSWHGAVCDPSKNDADTVAIRTLNDKIGSDPRVMQTTIQIADGLTLVTKL